MTTYVLGAGASSHAGYPLTAQLWPRLAAWIAKAGDDLKRLVESIVSLHGPVHDVELLLTDIDNGEGVFAAIGEESRERIVGDFRRAIVAYFKYVRQEGMDAKLYAAFAKLVKPGDTIISFNYDIALEQKLVQRGQFRVRNGYGFEGTWEEPGSPVKVLKPHGSVNWIALLFGGRSGFGADQHSLGDRPFVDNSDSALPNYPSRVLDTTFPGGGVVPPWISLILPTHRKRCSLESSVGEEWVPSTSLCGSRPRMRLGARTGWFLSVTVCPRLTAVRARSFFGTLTKTHRSLSVPDRRAPHLCSSSRTTVSGGSGKAAGLKIT